MSSRVSMFASAILASTCMTAVSIPGPAAAQAQQQVHQFDIAAGSLKTALTDYVRQSGKQVISRGSEVSKARTQGVHGALTDEAALAEILKGTGFSAKADASGAVAIMRNKPVAANPAAASDASASSDEVIVTGSRLVRNSFNSPTPVNVVGAERMQDLNIASVGDGLNQIPAFRPITSPSTNSFRAGANIAARSLDLRGLGTTRTLTLIDGRRNVPSDDSGTFDLNAIPSMMVQRSEVVTGGASAAYGADAVAGVVNLILNTKFKGVKGELSYGISDQKDAETINAGFQMGSGFAAGRGDIVIGGEYADERGVGDYNVRDWSKKYHSFIPNPFFNANPALSNGLPANVATDGVLYVMNPAGVISIAHPLQGMQFNDNGDLVPFQFGSLFNRARPSALMVGGDPSIKDLYGFNQTGLVVPTKHYSLLSHVGYDLTDTLRFSGELSFAHVEGGPSKGAWQSDQSGAITIRRDNPYLSASTAAAMDRVGVTTLPVSRSLQELGGTTYVSKNDTWRALVALDGDLGEKWGWDAFYQYGRSTSDEVGTSQLFSARWTQAVDAVRAPNGTIVCRSTLTNPTNGCVPANVMGAGKITAATKAWVLGNAAQDREFTQHNVAANLHGTLFQTWAGDVAVATGAEYRTFRSGGGADANSVGGLYRQQNVSILPQTEQKVTEGYLEISVPLLNDSPLGKTLDIDGAVRKTSYSLSGDATTWKYGVVYEPSNEFLFRVTKSNDIRAPSPAELNPNQTSRDLTQADPLLLIQYQMPARLGGNPNLHLERADTITVGTVYQPFWLSKFRLSLDYYDIKVDDAIDTISIPLAVQICRAGTNPEVCVIGTDSLGNPNRILQLYATYQNVNQLRARGYELVSNYSFDLTDLYEPLSGKLDFTLNANYVNTLSTTLPDGTRREFADQTGNAGSVTTIFGVPKWRADLVMTYSQPRYSLTAQVKYIPEGILNRDWIGPDDSRYTPYLANSVNNNRIASATYLNLNGRVQLTGEDRGNIELFGGVNNVMNLDPPANLRFTGNGLYFDPIGRAYKIGLRANW